MVTGDDHLTKSGAKINFEDKFVFICYLILKRYWKSDNRNKILRETNSGHYNWDSGDDVSGFKITPGTVAEKVWDIIRHTSYSLYQISRKQDQTKEEKIFNFNKNYLFF